MTARPDLMQLQHRYRDDIIKILDRVQASGRRSSQIFEDWTELVHANLVELPRHVAAQAKGEPHEDLPDTQKVFERLRNVYRREYFELFGKAMGTLLMTADAGYMDVVGSVYMEWGWPSKGHGQYFTPLNVSNMMAQILTAENGERELNARLKEAIYKSTLASAMMVAGTLIDDPQQAESWLVARVIPAAMEHYEPLTVLDPAVGSGIMLLSHASTMPWWAVQLGLVQYYGQDIDYLCVRMAQINLLLYGMNGRYAPFLVAYHDWRLQHGAPVQAEAPASVTAGDAAVETAPDPEPPPDPPVLSEEPGWDADDYIQTSLFNGVREPAPLYEK